MQAFTRELADLQLEGIEAVNISPLKQRGHAIRAELDSLDEERVRLLVG